MKMRMMMGGILLWGLTPQAQTLDEWLRQKQTQLRYYAQQITSLEIYRETLQQGYGVLREGLHGVRDRQQGTLELYAHYFASMSTINPSIGNDPWTSQVPTLFQQLTDVCQATQILLPALTEWQGKYISRVLQGLRAQADQCKRQYDLLTSSGAYALTDAERIQQIQQEADALHDQYQFSNRLHHQVALLLTQQRRTRNDAKAIHQLYQLP